MYSLFVWNDIVGHDAHCIDMRSGGKKRYLFMAFYGGHWNLKTADNKSEDMRWTMLL